MPGGSPPLSTYRLQVHGGFGFDAARAVLDHVAALGVTHVYLSPVLDAVPGSVHGYDVVSHDRVSRDAGGRAAFDELADAAHALGLGVVVDVVPNHMAVPVPAHLNAPLWSVLREGRGSPYAHWFDVDWTVEDGRLLLPVLGATVEEVIAAGELEVARDGGPGGDETVLRYHEQELPVAPGTEALDLTDLVAAQAYRLDFWRDGEARLNYRRFFDVTALIAVRVEEPDVFEATHRLLLDLRREGRVDGYRIDHPDGLADPAGYLARLADASGDAWVVTEKILEGEETLPADWRCAGTTGYDALLRVQQLFVDPAGEAPLTQLWHEVSSDLSTLADIVVEAKAQVVDQVLTAEVTRLVRDIERILPGVDAGEVRLVLGELLVAMDRYRAYLVPGTAPDPASLEVLRAAGARARDALARDDAAVLDTVLGLVTATALPPGLRPTDPDVADVVVRFQQTCGPVMAKGVEDTAFYRYGRLAALGEVGGDPGRFGVSPAELHAFAAHTLATHPATMTAASTHDTKRSEDVRARLAVISERPEQWRAWVERARELADPHRRRGVDGATEYLLWQTLVGAWPIDRARVAAYVEKAIRESKARTTWTEVDQTYEDAVRLLVDGLVADPRVRAHLDDWVAATAGAARAVTLGQKALQLSLPGVPDTYQGTELVDLSLVDPDNRRPVDYADRRARLARLDAGAAPADLSDEKLALTAALLRLRREHPGWFVGPTATYAAAPTTSEYAVAVARGDDTGIGLVTVVTRLPTRVEESGGWADHVLVLPPGRWLDLLQGTEIDSTSGSVRLADVLAHGPVAVLRRLA